MLLVKEGFSCRVNIRTLHSYTSWSTYVWTNVMHVNGLELAFVVSVNPIMKFTNILCKCIIFIYILVNVNLN
jgi:hypothetical protein